MSNNLKQRLADVPLTKGVRAGLEKAMRDVAGGYSNYSRYMDGRELRGHVLAGWEILLGVSGHVVLNPDAPLTAMDMHTLRARVGKLLRNGDGVKFERDTLDALDAQDGVTARLALEDDQTLIERLIEEFDAEAARNAQLQAEGRAA